MPTNRDGAFTGLLSVDFLMHGRVGCSFIELILIGAIKGEDPLAALFLDFDEHHLLLELDVPVLFDVEVHTFLEGVAGKLEQLG